MDIGIWYSVIEGLTFFGLITNLFIILLTMNTVHDHEFERFLEGSNLDVRS